jgi:hypothetical protein
MKNKNFNGPFKYFLMIMIAISISSCSKKIAFLTSSVVPAARGDVQVHKDKNMNYVIHVHISELAEVSRLSPPRQSYVIWMVTDEDVTKNIGKINSKLGGMSKQLNASFETVSAFKPNKIFITAEDDASVQFPNSQIILSTDSF